MTIVTYVHRPKRARNRKLAPANPLRIATAKKPKPGTAAPAIEEAVTERKPAQPATITGPRIVTARKPSGRFADVPDMAPEEHERRGGAAEALFRELTRRVREE